MTARSIVTSVAFGTRRAALVATRVRCQRVVRGADDQCRDLELFERNRSATGFPTNPS
jgi:hypothetical protein